MHDYVAFPQSNLEKQVAIRMRQALQDTAQASLEVTCDVTAYTAHLARENGHMAFSTYAIYEAVQALRGHPELNAHLSADGLCRYRQVKLGVMVDTGRGVMLGCIPEAETLGLSALAGAIEELRHRARYGHIHMDETRGATFGVADLSMYAVDAFTPILVPSMVAILGLGRIRPGCLPDGETCRPARLLTLSLTVDHQGCDGLRAGRYLSSLVERLEFPGGVA